MLGLIKPFLDKSYAPLLLNGRKLIGHDITPLFEMRKGLGQPATVPVTSITLGAPMNASSEHLPVCRLTFYRLVFLSRGNILLGLAIGAPPQPRESKRQQT